jgi:hypothetical protein
MGNRTLTPYTHAEVFYDWRYNAFHRQRYGAGAEFEVSEHFVVCIFRSMPMGIPGRCR